MRIDIFSLQRHSTFMTTSFLSYIQTLNRTFAGGCNSLLPRLVLTFTALLLAGGIATARHDFNGEQHKRDLVIEESHAIVTLNGQSDIEGRYEIENGLLEISANGQSRLKIVGACYRVVIIQVNGQCILDLSGLKVGKGGVVIENMNGQSTVRLNSEGPIKVKTANGESEIRFAKTPDGPELFTGNRLGNARLIEEPKKSRSH